MCTFISLIAKSGDLLRINDALSAFDRRDYRRRADVMDPPLLHRVLADGEVEYILGTGSMCDCGTFLGSAVQDGPTSEQTLEKQADKYRRKGWSEAKIERALADQKGAADRPHRQSLSEDADYWISALGAVAAALDVPKLGLMHYFYTKDLMKDGFAPNRLNAGAIGNAAQILALMPDGVIHEFDCRSM